MALLLVEDMEFFDTRVVEVLPYTYVYRNDHRPLLDKDRGQWKHSTGEHRFWVARQLDLALRPAHGNHGLDVAPGSEATAKHQLVSSQGYQAI